MKAGIIAAIVAVLVIGGGAFLVMKKDNKSTATTPTTTQNTSTSASTTTDNSSSTNSNDSTGTTITYSDSGFSPSTITVKSGTKVTIKNTSSHDMQFDSDPHPVHTDDVDLNVGLVQPGKSMTFTVTKTGSFGYHNHLNASETGSIVVQ